MTPELPLPELPPVFAPSFVALAAAIAAATGVALWWLLRREGTATLLVLALLTSLSLTLRVLHTDDYPRGLNEDEPKVLYAAGKAVVQRTLLAESNISVPILHHALFQGQLIPVLGPGRWSIRLYDLVCGVLTTAAAFAAARGLGMRVAPSLLAGALLATLPWSLLYSRVMQGASLTLYQLLLVAALARLVCRGGGWREIALGGGALAWLLYGYWCTRAMLPMPLVAAVLARGWRARLGCVAILAIGWGLYQPYVEANRGSIFISQGAINPLQFASAAEIARLAGRSRETLAALVEPVAANGWLTVRAGAVHPWLALALAAVGVFGGVRRGLFLVAGLALGLLPTVLAWDAPSTHRMMMAFPFLALAAAGAVDLVRRPLPRRLLAVAVAAAVGWASVRFYFSDDFWRTESRWLFDWQRTELLESLPLDPPQPVIFMRQVTFFRDPRRLVAAGDQDLTVDNWLPDARGAIYAFAPDAVTLRPFYERLFGAERVQPFGWAFSVTLEPGDWSSLRRHGWWYTARCGNVEREALVPTLVHQDLGFADFACEKASRHVWRGRWAGPATTVRVRGVGILAVSTPRGEVRGETLGPQQYADVSVQPGDAVMVTLTVAGFRPAVHIALTELTPLGERVPDWEHVLPMARPEVAAAEAEAAAEADARDP